MIPNCIYLHTLGGGWGGYILQTFLGVFFRQNKLAEVRTDLFQ